MKSTLVLVLISILPTFSAASDREVGTLFLSGGGTSEPRVFEKFTALAGGRDASIVVIPTASTIADRDDAEQYIQQVFDKYFQSSNASMLHTRDREIADTDAFADRILDADGVWIWGGQAKRFTSVYVGTRVQDALMQRMNDGGLIGGTSSGAVVLVDLVVRPGDTETSEIVKSNNIAGTGLLDGVLLDVHAMARNRIVPMLNVIDEYPGRTAISIDENTAIIVRGDIFEVFGRSYVTVYNVKGRMEPFTFLGEGDHFSFELNSIVSDDCSMWSAGCVEVHIAGHE